MIQTPPAFNCTACGQCCRNLKLPLGLTEAIDWLHRGDRVQVICEAIPWVTEPDAASAMAAHKRSLSFAAMSGHLPVRVLVYFVAAFDGACPNLGEHNLCEVYDNRPLTCRIYPAEVNPFVATDPAQKACPPDAWQSVVPLMTDTMQKNVNHFRQRGQAEVPRKAWICEQLGIHLSAISNQGYAIHMPEPALLLRALLASSDADLKLTNGSWTLITHVAENVQTLQAMGSLCTHATSVGIGDVQYVSFV
jgi:Fe-S-cluster containining protein